MSINGGYWWVDPPLCGSGGEGGGEIGGGGLTFINAVIPLTDILLYSEYERQKEKERDR